MTTIQCLTYELGMCTNELGKGWNHYTAPWLLLFFLLGFLLSYIICKKKKANRMVPNSDKLQETFTHTKGYDHEED